MSLIVTMGASNAESYLTATEASAYLAATSFYDDTDWDALTEAEQEERLVQAALAMNTIHWSGWRVYTNQALAFPRWREALDEDDVEIPVKIQQAQAFIAYGVIHREILGISDPSAGVGGQAVDSLGLFGSLSVSFTNSTPAGADGTIFDRMSRSEYGHISRLISPWRSTVKIRSKRNTQPACLAEVTGS